MPDHSGKSGGASTTISLRARRVAAVQFRVKRPRKRLRVMRNHADIRRAEAGGNFGVRDDVSMVDN